MKWRRRVSVALAVIVLGGAVPLQGWGADNRPETANASVPVNVNLDHMDRLQDEVVLDGTPMALTRIYSEYPDYGWVGDGDEGIGCVDDTARAAVVYLTEYERTGKREYLARARHSLNFVMHMQADDGEFYNFVFEDYSINREGKTSRKSMSWWAARAMWALGHGYRVFEQEDPVYAEKLRGRFLLANRALHKKIGPHYGEYRSVHGVKVPAWIDEYDALANALLGLTEFYRAERSPAVRDSMIMLGNGLSRYQLGTVSDYPYRAHLPWSGSIQLWHAWGSTQPMALARSGQLLGRRDYIRSAQRSADGLHARLLISGLIKETAPTPAKFEQIAYGANSMVQNLLAVSEATGDPLYAKWAGLAGSWFTGNNPAEVRMYDAQTGRGYDGILSREKINRNAGAESTIEALMAMQSLADREEARLYLSASRVRSDDGRILEAEEANPLRGRPETVAPKEPWTGESLYSGQIVRLRDGDTIGWEVDMDHSRTWQWEAVFEKRALREGTGRIALTIDGKKAGEWSADGSPDRDFLWKESLIRKRLSAGKQRVEITFRGRGNFIVDNLSLRPVKSRAVFRLNGGKQATLTQDLGSGRNRFEDR